MIFYHKGAGVVSNIALLANLFFSYWFCCIIWCINLPGIAGIVLTIGMAVCGCERTYLRAYTRGNETRKGLALALKDGYSKAYTAIIDANLTTLLLMFFTVLVVVRLEVSATTLIIGIFTSLFSAIVITRLIFFLDLIRRRASCLLQILLKIGSLTPLLISSEACKLM